MRLTKEQRVDYRGKLSTMGLSALEGFTLFDTIDALERDLDAAVALRTKEAAAALDSVESTVEFYLKREISAPANSQEFAREAQEKLTKFRAAKALLSTSGTAALEAHDAEIISGVMSIRCMKHREVPQLNTSEASGAECPICEIDRIRDAIVTDQTTGAGDYSEAEEYANKIIHRG
jgi:hypothetical protein